MFRSVCTLLTVFAVLAHSVLGCRVCHAACRHADCKHTEHAANDGAAPPACASQHGKHACRCSERPGTLSTEPTDNDAPAEKNPPHAPVEPCRAVGCSYVTVSIVKLPVLDAPECELLLGDLFAFDAPAQLACVARAADGYRSGYPPTERAQVWNGAWLV